MAARLPLYERYMRDEEREDDARIAANWRGTRPADLADDDWEPAMYTQSQLDAVVARALAKVSAFWFVACLIVVYVALTGVH